MGGPRGRLYEHAKVPGAVRRMYSPRHPTIFPSVRQSHAGGSESGTTMRRLKRALVELLRQFLDEVAHHQSVTETLGNC